jgi:hypothetical protein
MVFSVQSASDAAVSHLESPSSSRQKKPQQDRPEGKVMFVLFFDSSGIVHLEFIPEGSTANKHHYKEIPCCLRSLFCCKHPELWRRKNWLLLYNNAPAHHSVLVLKRSWQNSGSPFCHTL